MADQLLAKKKNIYPKVETEQVLKTDSGNTITDHVNQCDHVFLVYKDSVEDTLLQVPNYQRRRGLWVSYVLNDSVITGWYKSSQTDDESWQSEGNWDIYTKYLKTVLDSADTASALAEESEELIETTNDYMEQAEASLAEAEEALEAAQTAIALTNSTISDTTTKQAEVEQSISEVNSVITELKEVIATLSAAITILEANTDEISEQITNIETVIVSSQEAITSLNTLVTSMEELVEPCEEATESVQEALTNIEQTLADIKRALLTGIRTTNKVNLLSSLDICRDVIIASLRSTEAAWLEWDADYTCTGYTSDDVPTTLNTWKGTSGSTALTDLTRLWAVNMSAGTSMYYAFRYQTALEELDLRGLDTSSVTNMYGTFYNCSSLTSLDVSSWDTSNVTTMYYTFYNCSSLTSLDVSSWDTSSVTNMSGTFYNCSSLTSLDLSSWDTSSVTNMQGTFRNCTSLTSLDVSSWDTSSVTTLYYTFAGTSLTSLDVSSWDTSSVTTISSAFDSANSLTTIDLSPWDGSAMTDITGLIKGNIAVELLILPSNLSKITSLANLSYAHYTSFDTRRGTPCLVEIDLNDADCSNVTTFGSTWYTGMIGEGNSFNGFNGIMDCSSITGGTIAVSVNGYSYKVFYYWKIKNLGKASALTSLSFSNIPYYGKDTDGTWHDGTSWNGLESLQYTLANLYDRASAGYSTCTLYFCSYGTYTYITDEELADAVEKGYTIAASS